jgi:hypothetical protein
MLPAAFLLALWPSAATAQVADVELAWQADTLWTLSGDGTSGLLLSDLEARDLAVSENGQILLLDRAGRRVYIIENGNVQDSLFREGPGPGELLRPVSLTLDGDGNPAVFDRGKGVLERRSLASGDILPTMRVGAGVVGGCVQVVSDRIAYKRLDATPTGGARYALYTNRADEKPQLLANGPSFNTVQVDYPSCNRSLTAVPHFTHLVPWSSNRSGILAVVPGPEYRIEIFVGTRRQRVVSRELQAMEVTRSLALAKLEDYSIGDCPVPPSEALSGRGHADVIPAIRSLMLAPNGELWVEREPSADDRQRVDVFTPGGTYVGTLVDFPFPSAILGPTQILVVSVDDLGVPSINAVAVERR